MLQQPADAAIVRGVIDLASAFGLQCVAEGAETHRHLEQLQLLGCDLAQGLGVAAAMPADSFAAWGRWRLRGAQA